MPSVIERRVCRGLCAIVACVCALVLTGCIADGPQPSPKPNLGPQPGNAQADVLLLNLGPPSDTDGDTIPDTFIASVHAFDERYQLPIRVNGKMSFSLLVTGTDEPLHTWTFEGRELQRQVIQAQVGPVHRFRLSVPTGSDPVREKYVNVQCVFESVDGMTTQAWHRDLPWLSVGR